jgi:hypothetical protein
MIEYSYCTYSSTKSADTPDRCSAILPRFGERFFGPARLEDENDCQLSARLLTDRADEQRLQITLYAYGGRFRTLLWRTPKTEFWRSSDFTGLLAVGPQRRYWTGATLLRNGLLKVFLRPLHLHAAVSSYLVPVPGTPRAQSKEIPP